MPLAPKHSKEPFWPDGARLAVPLSRQFEAGFQRERGAESSFVKKTILAGDGLGLVGEVRGQGDTALVFLHGWCGDREYWKHQVGPFAADYRVVTLDQAGHGESGKNRTVWSAAGLAGDVEAVAKSLGLKRVILFGLDTVTAFKEAKVPVRCINSAGGYQFFTPTAVETNKKYADFGAVTIDGVGHYPMLEKPDEFNRRLRDVLKELVTRK